MTGSIYIIHLKERRAMYEAKQGTLCIIQDKNEQHQNQAINTNH